MTRDEATKEFLEIAAQLTDSYRGPATRYPPGSTPRNRFGKIAPDIALYDRLRVLFRAVGGRSGGTDFIDQLARTAAHILAMEPGQ